MLPQKHHLFDPYEIALALAPNGRLSTWYRYTIDGWPHKTDTAYFYRRDLRRFRPGAELLLMALGIPYATRDEPWCMDGPAFDLLANGSCLEPEASRPPPGAIRIGIPAFSRLLRTITDRTGWAD